MRTAACLTVFLVMSVAFADDEIKLKNGDRITGKITGLAGGKLVIETTHSGPLKVDWAQVVSVKTDHPIKVKLVTGEMLEGKITPGADGRFKVETVGAAAAVEIEHPKVAFFNEPPNEWHGSLSAAARATDGNTHTKSFLIAGEGTRESDMDLFLLRAIFRYGQQGHTLIERNSYGIAKYQLKFTPRLYGYISEELMSDTFKDIELESITSVGAGYDIFKEPWGDLSAEAGIAYFDNNFKVAPDESHLGARAAVKVRIALPLGFEFKDLFTIYPNFKHSQDYQLRNEATLGTALGGGWTLLGGVITEFDNRPNPGLKKQDDTYFVGLGLKF